MRTKQGPSLREAAVQNNIEDKRADIYYAILQMLAMKKIINSPITRNKDEKLNHVPQIMKSKIMIWL